MTENYSPYPSSYSPASGPKRFARDLRRNWFGGVCAGIGRYFDVSPNVVRAIFVASCLLPGPQFVIYLLLWLVMPKD